MFFCKSSDHKQGMVTLALECFCNEPDISESFTKLVKFPKLNNLSISIRSLGVRSSKVASGELDDDDCDCDIKDDDDAKRLFGVSAVEGG